RSRGTSRPRASGASTTTRTSSRSARASTPSTRPWSSSTRSSPSRSAATRATSAGSTSSRRTSGRAAPRPDVPEGHTVHRLARAFGELFTGEALAVSSPHGRFAAGAALLDGHVLVASEAWGKQLFLGFGDPAHAGAGRAAPRPDLPEAHTVHRLARAFGARVTGEALAVSSPQGRFAAGAALLDGHVLVASEAWGKQLFLGFADPAHAGAGRTAPDADDVRWLRVHLGLYGAWTFAGDGSTAVVHAIGAPRRRIGERETVPAGPGEAAEADGAWSPPPPRGAVRVRLVGAHAVADLTGPTACEVVDGAEKRAVEDRLGPDPIRERGPGEPD